MCIQASTRYTNVFISIFFREETGVADGVLVTISPHPCHLGDLRADVEHTKHSMLTNVSMIISSQMVGKTCTQMLLCFIYHNTKGKTKTKTKTFSHNFNSFLHLRQRQENPIFLRCYTEQPLFLIIEKEEENEKKEKRKQPNTHKKPTSFRADYLIFSYQNFFWFSPVMGRCS